MSEDKQAKFLEYCKLSQAYRGRAPQGTQMLTGELLTRSVNLAGVCNCTWGTLENHAASLYNAAVMGKKQKASSTPASVTPLRTTIAQQ